MYQLVLIQALTNYLLNHDRSFNFFSKPKIVPEEIEKSEFLCNWSMTQDCSEAQEIDIKFQGTALIVPDQSHLSLEGPLPKQTMRVGSRKRR